VDLCLMIEGQDGVTWSQWVALASACEEHGIPALFRSDHYMDLDGLHPEHGALDAWATITALAGLTTGLRLGSLVSPATFRHPSNLARVVTTADHVSGGRIDLGLGAGWHEREHEAHGFAFPPTGERMEILEEQLQIVLGAWADGPFSFAGEHYTIRDHDALPKPVQRPHPPLIMGGKAGPRSSAMAARFADEYNTPYPTLDDIRERRGRIETAFERAEREMIPFSTMSGVLVGTDRAELVQRARLLVELIGGDAESFLSTPPPGWVVGTVDEVAEQLGAMRDAGVDRVMCQHLLVEDLEAVALIGSELAPRLA
jgi:alkanesulfonate monooxygenase SsuD/methylene tetrahydromethanopterin reductase-like flavin-dependent oxidoreductase (luciferase family)